MTSSRWVFAALLLSLVGCGGDKGGSKSGGNAVLRSNPFDTRLDISSFTVAPDGAIDFLATRTDTSEKVHGTIPAGATTVTMVAAGKLDPAKVIAFTRID